MTAVSDREADAFVGNFQIHADRKAPAFVMLRSGLSHKGGCIQHILSVDEARRLGLGLLDAAQFASEPTFSDRIAAAKRAKTEA